MSSTFEEITKKNTGEDKTTPVQTGNAPAPVQKQAPAIPVPPAEMPGRISMAEWFQRTSPYRPPTPEQLADEKKKQKREAIMNAIGDGISAISNLITTTNSAPSMYNPAASLSANSKKRWDKLQADREANQKQYMEGYMRAKAYDDDMANRDRDWKFKLDQAVKADQRHKDEQAHRKEREGVADRQWQQTFEANEKQRKAANQHAREQLRATEQYHKDSVEARKMGYRAAAAKGVRGKRLAFSDGSGNEVGIYENVWKGSMQQVFDTLMQDMRPKTDYEARKWDRNMKKMTPQQKQDFVQQNWNKSPKAAAIMLALSNIDPDTMNSYVEEEDKGKGYGYGNPENGNENGKGKGY